MNFWKSWDTISDAVNARVLIKFENGHIEDATIHEMGDYVGGFHYYLYDGSTLTHTPVEWAWIPEESNFVSMP